MKRSRGFTYLGGGRREIYSDDGYGEQMVGRGKSSLRGRNQQLKGKKNGSTAAVDDDERIV